MQHRLRHRLSLRPRFAVALGLSLSLAAAPLFLGACGGGGGSSGGGATAGVELPSEISAVAASESGEEIRLGRAVRESRGLGAALRALQARAAGAVEDLPADCDYNNVVVKKFVEIELLDIFDIIEQIFDALRQTHHEDHVGDGWYKVLVAWEDQGQGGVTQTFLQEWYVRSFYTGGSSGTYHVQIKVLEQDDRTGELRLIRGQADVEEEPTENEDGTLADLGVWEIRAVFGAVGEEIPEGEAPSDFFHATADVLEDGTSRLTIEEQFVETIPGGEGGEDQEFSGGTRAIVFRSQTAGYGKAEYPNWDACFGPGGGGCEGGPPPVTVSFAYNENYLSVDPGDGDVRSFDRGDEHEIVHRYMIFNSTDGSNVERDRTFGFSVRVDGDGDNRFGWYGAWQDHHQLWFPGDPLADGSTVVRNDVPPGEEAPSYTTRSFAGALTRIELVEGSLDQLQGIPAEIWLFNNFRLRWNDVDGRWDECVGDDGMGGCGSIEDFTSRLPSLAYAGDGDQRSIWIQRCGDDGMGGFFCTNYVYDTQAAPAGFYEAEMDPQTGRWQSTGVLLDTAALPPGFELFGSIGGRTYIQYTGEFAGPTTMTGWVEKTLIEFDTETWTPSFDDAADREFAFELGREYFVNNRGTNLRVTRVAEAGDPSDYRVFMESQTVAKPAGDLGDVYPPGTVLVEPWDPENNSTYTLNTDPESANYLLLEYATVSERDANDGALPGDVVTRDLWGMRVEGDMSPIEDATLYSWSYQGEGEFWGGVTYLVDEFDEFVLLSDPIRFEPIQLARTDDIVRGRPVEEWLTYSLVFDGWLHGLPDTWFELHKVHFEGDQIPSILANNVRIPDGTELVDAEDPETTYYVKGVDVGIFLGLVTAFPEGDPPDITLADDIDLDADLPAFETPDMDATVPENAELLYIEGIPVD